MANSSIERRLGSAVTEASVVLVDGTSDLPRAIAAAQQQLEQSYPDSEIRLIPFTTSDLTEKNLLALGQVLDSEQFIPLFAHIVHPEAEQGQEQWDDFFRLLRTSAELSRRVTNVVVTPANRIRYGFDERGRVHHVDGSNQAQRD